MCGARPPLPTQLHGDIHYAQQIHSSSDIKLPSAAQLSWLHPAEGRQQDLWRNLPPNQQAPGSHTVVTEATKLRGLQSVALWLRQTWLHGQLHTAWGLKQPQCVFAQVVIASCLFQGTTQVLAFLTASSSNTKLRDQIMEHQCLQLDGNLRAFPKCNPTYYSKTAHVQRKIAVSSFCNYIHCWFLVHFTRLQGYGRLN